MPIPLPDSVKHNNSDYPIVLPEDIGGTSRVVTPTFSNTVLLAIPINKRATGSIIFSETDKKYYAFEETDTSDIIWGDTLNWTELGAGGAGGGNLELDAGVSMTTTPVAISDTSGNKSQLLLATDQTVVEGTLEIKTDNETIVDITDESGNNLLAITKITGEEKTNIDFGATPSEDSDVVGAIRTIPGLSDFIESLQFLKDGSIIGADTPDTSNFIIQKLPNNDLVIYSPFVWGGIQEFPSSGNGNTMINGLITGTHGGYGNVVIGLGTTLVADGSAYNFNVVIGQGSFTRGGSNVSIGNYAMCGEISTVVQRAVAIGYNSQAYGNDCITLGSDTSKLHLGGNFAPEGRVHIKGLGSTSATKSLVVQNLAGTEKTTIYGDGAVVIGGTKEASAKLQVESTTKGFLPPRMTTTQMNAISSPAEGLIIFNTTVSNLYCYQSGTWVEYAQVGSKITTTLSTGSTVNLYNTTSDVGLLKLEYYAKRTTAPNGEQEMGTMYVTYMSGNPLGVNNWIDFQTPTPASFGQLTFNVTGGPTLDITVTNPNPYGMTMVYKITIL